MIIKFFVFRHTETFDNLRKIFSGWRDSKLTTKGLLQANKIAEQLKNEEINYAFTSHLSRALFNLDIILKYHSNIQVFIDDRLIERCYGILQGKSKDEIARKKPEWFVKVHRGYDFSPPEGESLKMVENRVLSFLNQLIKWLQDNPGNVIISSHGNSMRPIRKFFENLNTKQMLQIENPQDRSFEYAFEIQVYNKGSKTSKRKSNWESILVPKQIKLATDPRNPLKKYY